MGKELIVFASKNGVISDIKESDKLVLFNMDTGEREVINNPLLKGFSQLEEFFEERDPSVLFVSEIDEELEYLIEENGVHVKKYPSRKIDEVIRELFIRG